MTDLLVHELKVGCVIWWNFTVLKALDESLHEREREREGGERESLT